MAEEPKMDAGESVTSTDTEIKKTKKKKGVFSRLWNAIFRGGGDDFEKRLKHISKEEAAVLARVTRRSQSWQRMARQLIIFSVLLEVIAVGYAVMTTRSLNLNWKMRTLRVLPMFLLPALSFITFSAMGSYTKMRDRKDHKTLEKLRAEMQEKIDELKERTNYYTTQQLIQRYDPDPAAKAAAATVLASKLGADSGLKLHVIDESNPTGKCNDVKVARTGGLRNRKSSSSDSKTTSTEIVSMSHPEEGMLRETGFDGMDTSQQCPLVVEHYPQMGQSANDGGWIARLAALLVGEDPTQSYALICGNCHMHNGLARKEDFPYVTYYCPHCNALNRSKRAGELSLVSNSPTTMATSSPIVDDAPSADASTVDTVSDTVSSSNSPLATAIKGTPES